MGSEMCIRDRHYVVLTCLRLLFHEKVRTNILKTFVKFGFPELSTGAKKSSGSGDLENRGFGQTVPKNTRSKLIVSGLRGSAVENSAGVDNKRLGPIWLLAFCPCSQTISRKVTARKMG